MQPSDVTALLPAPDQYGRPTFLSHYVHYASYCCDAPVVYHIGVGLTIFAAAVAARVQCPWQAGGSFAPNLYTVLVGSSAAPRKTTAMDTGIKILRDANEKIVMPVPGSHEELIEQLRATPAGLLTYREFAHFLKVTSRGYAEPLRTVIMDAYDSWGTEYTRVLRKGKTAIRDLAPSMLAAVATEFLFGLTDKIEWVGGFFGRAMLLFGTRTDFHMPRQWPEYRAWLGQRLKQFSEFVFPHCAGFDPYAQQDLSMWAQWQDSQVPQMPVAVQTHIARAHTLAAKIALLYAVDRGEWMNADGTVRQGWMISHDSTRRAMLFVDQVYINSIKQLGDRIAWGPWERDRRRVLDVIEMHPKGVLRGDLIHAVKMQNTLVDQHVDTLREERIVAFDKGAAGITYRRVRDNEDPHSGGSGSGGGGQPDNGAPIIPITSARSYGGGE